MSKINQIMSDEISVKPIRVYRIHIRPYGGTPNMSAAFEYCKKHGVLGVGWRVDIENTNDWKKYYAVACDKYPNDLKQCEYINKWVTPGDLVWTRDTKGEYYLARVTSRWHYWTCQETKDLDIDIGNVFSCEIKEVPIDSVPGKVVACFRPNRTMQEIVNPCVNEYSKQLWNELAKKEQYKIDFNVTRDIFTMLDSEETEDVLFLYFQTVGWFVVPNSRKTNTMAYEYLLKNRKTGEVATVQVKTGEDFLNREQYSNLKHKVFLFQSNGKYSGIESPNVTCLCRDDISRFLMEFESFLPEIIKRKLACCKPNMDTTRLLQ